jgi:conjugal transfer pilus assembly protein TraE
VKFWNYWDKVTSENKLFKNIFIILTATIVILVFFIMKLADNKRVLVIPPRVDKEFWVAGNEVSTTYLEQVASYIADMVMNVSPVNVDRAYDTILPFLTTDPELVGLIRTELLTQADTIKEEDIYQSFYIRKVWIDKENHSITVSGISRRSTGNLYIGSQSASVKITYKISNGKFIITKLEVNDGFED